MTVSGVKGMIKNIHVLTALISLSLFVLRGLGHFRDARFMRQRWLRIIPHINDTVLLLSAGMLALQIGQYPFSADWLTAKFLALLIYIMLGMVALKWARTLPLQISAWLAALMVFAYIISVAVTKQVQGLFLIWLS